MNVLDESTAGEELCSVFSQGPHPLSRHASKHLVTIKYSHQFIVRRTSPVIVLTGTPGTGKTTHAQLLIQDSSVALKYVNVGELVKMEGLHQGFDEERGSFTVDEDNLLDHLEPLASAGGIVLDWHTCDLFPERWADLVVVLRCHHTLFWDRLEKRGYPLKKIQENNEAEIINVVSHEAKESYQPSIVAELESNTMMDLQENVSRIVTWIDQWISDNDKDENSDDNGGS